MSAWNLPPLTEAEIERHVRNIENDGYSLLLDAIPPAIRGEICAELDRLELVRPGGDIPPAPFTGRVTRRWFDLLNDGEVWQQVAVHPWLMQILPRVLGEGFLLSTLGSAVVGPGEPAQPIHVDDGVYAFPRPHPNLVCNTMWALSDFTDLSGATRVVPGSNRWSGDPAPDEVYETIPLEMPAGGIALVVGSLYHGAGANRSSRDRVALTTNYCSGSMRQQENLMLAISPARLMSFAPELQDILGFRICKGAGHIFAQDPRVEMMRHYPDASAQDVYLTRRNDLHQERLASHRSRVRNRVEASV